MTGKKDFGGVTARVNIVEESDSIATPTSRDGYLWAARDFAGTLGDLRDPTRYVLGSGMLAGQALECALKAHLVTTGLTVEELSRSPYGHKIEALWVGAAESGLKIDKQMPPWAVVLDQVHSAPYWLRYPLGIHGIQTPNMAQTIAGLRTVLAAVEAT